jgi:hypothetical protein
MSDVESPLLLRLMTSMRNDVRIAFFSSLLVVLSIIEKTLASAAYGMLER